MYITRTIENTVKRISESHKVMLVVGASGVGKTTMLKRLADSDYTYVSLDNIADRFFALTEPDLFLHRYEPPVFIDEIQYAPKLLSYIKEYIDAEGKNGDIWIASSQRDPLLQDAQEIFGEAVGVVDLLGLSVAEINGTENTEAFLPISERLIERSKVAKPFNVKKLYELIWRGSMPAMYNGDPEDWERYYASYLQTFLTRDVMKMVKLEDEILFYRFLCVAASQIGKVVNYAELAAASDITAPTAKKWIKVLEAAGIVYLLPPFAPPGAKYVVKVPKLCFLDTGLAAYLLSWDNPKVLEKGASSGAFFESWVVGMIYKGYSNEGKVPPFYYFRNFNSREIELIICENETAYPIAIKNTTSPEKAVKGMAGIDYLKEDVEGLKFGEKSVICLIDSLSVTEKGTQIIPAWMI